MKKMFSRGSARVVSRTRLTKGADVKHAPSDLPGVVKEIASALIDGDWTRYADDSGEHFYYVIREQDHSVEVQNRRPFGSMVVFEKVDPGYFEQWYMRAAFAAESPDYLEKARKQLAAAGVDPQFFHDVSAALQSDSETAIGEVFERWSSRRITDERLEALLAILGAIRIARTRSGQLMFSESDRPALLHALEARFLRELTELFPKLVKRAAGFDWLSFTDPRVQEASRCYVYGFLRAAVLVSTSALEERLKEVTGHDRLPSYNALVDSAFGQNGICRRDHPRANALKDLFKLRNDIAHDGLNPTHEQAVNALDLVRDTLGILIPQDEVG